MPWLIPVPLDASSSSLGRVSVGFPHDLAVQVLDLKEPESGEFVKGNMTDPDHFLMDLSRLRTQL